MKGERRLSPCELCSVTPFVAELVRGKGRLKSRALGVSLNFKEIQREVVSPYLKKKKMISNRFNVRLA